MDQPKPLPKPLPQTDDEWLAALKNGDRTFAEYVEFMRRETFGL